MKMLYDYIYFIIYSVIAPITFDSKELRYN